MGDLILCSGPAATVPYYIEGVSVNIYSLEELCYYITNNTYLLDNNFMCAELCIWLEHETDNAPLAERLADLMRRKGKLSEFVKLLLKESGYCTAAECKEILQILREMEEKSDFERNKIRADRLMEREKYLSCIYEYKRLLDMEDAETQPQQLLGDIWHNLGTAYARMFLFDEAEHCFEKAFGLNQRADSLKARLFSYKCMQRDIDFMRVAREYGMQDTAIAAVGNEIALHYRGEQVEQLRNRLEEIGQLRENNRSKEYKQQIQDTIFAWKEEYRYISRI